MKCADNQNSIWFIFSPHGYPVYMNIKHEMQLLAQASEPCQVMSACVCAFTPLGFGLIVIVSFYVPFKKFSCFSRLKLYVDCGLGVWLFLRANAEEKYPKHFNGLSSKEVDSLLNLINRQNRDCS